MALWCTYDVAILFGPAISEWQGASWTRRKDPDRRKGLDSRSLPK